jgi:hypothetical protein
MNLTDEERQSLADAQTAAERRYREAMADPSEQNVNQAIAALRTLQHAARGLERSES